MSNKKSAQKYAKEFFFAGCCSFSPYKQKQQQQKQQQNKQIMFCVINDFHFYFLQFFSFSFPAIEETNRLHKFSHIEFQTVK